MDTIKSKHAVLALADDAVLAMSKIDGMISELGVEEYDAQIVTQALSLNNLPLESSTIDEVIFICSSVEAPGLFQEISRVLKPGGIVLVHFAEESITDSADKEKSSLERRLLLAGFLETEGLQLKSVGSSGVKGKKPSWKIGSSFAIKKTVKSSVKVQIDDDSDLIDEDSLLTEEDLKKPQLPPVGDCEVGATRKACKNCTCGRAEEEEKVKLGLTMDQLNNPQSACGNCGLGDAFRCGTCPYKGRPPFKLGEKVSLSDNFLAAEI